MISLKKLFFIIIIITGVQLSAQQKFEKIIQDINIPYEKFVIDNGLTLIVHEDRKAPIVAVNVWYHVGAKNEKQGKTGFAHLFEHIMFNGSENYDDDYFQIMESIGATDLNGTTNSDRTNYFQNVPASALDIALWLESDRMGHLLGAVTQEKLDEQRGVVQNEKRQGESQPYGKVWELIAYGTYPAAHPYHGTVIGLMEDLEAASLEDIHEWFKTYYGPNNAVIAIAGDIDPKTALEKVKKYFGDIPPSPPIAKYEEWIAKRTGTQRQIIQDRVPQSRIYKVWNVPQWGTKESDYLDLFSDVLASGKTSRLYKRLVYDEQIATSVSSFVFAREIGGQFFIDVMAKPGEDLAKIEKAINEELEKLLKEGPTEKELDRVKTQYISRFVRGIERIGGFGGKSDILAANMVYGNDPSFYKTTLERRSKAKAEDLRKVAQEWLSDGVYVLEVHPFPNLAAVPSEIDRTKVPDTDEFTDVKFPVLHRAELSNGLKVILAQRKSIPVVNFNLLFDAGYAADQFTIPGTAKLTMDMMDEGTKKMDALQISEALSMLGAQLSSGAGLDNCNVYLSSLKANLGESLDIFADVVLNPSFPENELERLRKQLLASIQREKVTPVQMALRVFPKLLYGEGHAYGNPFTGSGTESSIMKISRDDIIKFHNDWLRPNNATLIIVGDIALNEILPKLESLFKSWQPGSIPRKNLSEVALRDKVEIYILDRPGSEQSLIFAGHVALGKANPDEIAIQSMNNILGGNFTSRINMNLREDKGWSYGSFSFLWSSKGQRPYVFFAPVQTDKTKESMIELRNEIEAFLSDKPVSAEEFEKDKKNQILSLPGSWETMGSVGGSITELVTYGYPDDYYDKYSDMVESLQISQLHDAAQKLLKPDSLIWVIVGDRSKIEQHIKELGFGEVKFLDGDGNVIN